MASWSPAEFVQAVVLDQCHARAVVVGEGFRYGSRASGSIETLAASGAAARLHRAGAALAGDERSLLVHPRACGGRRGRCPRPPPSCSAGRTRSRAWSSRATAAAARSGSPPRTCRSTTPTPCRPTACTPPACDDRHEVLPGATSVGTNPTFDGARPPRRVLRARPPSDGGSLDLYGELVRVEFVRAAARAWSPSTRVDALVAQMHEDVADTRSACSPDLAWRSARFASRTAALILWRLPYNGHGSRVPR